MHTFILNRPTNALGFTNVILLQSNHGVFRRLTPQSLVVSARIPIKL